jgi:hypothetical protein
VKETLIDSVLPLFAVCALVAGITWLGFDVPAEAPLAGAVGAGPLVPTNRASLNTALTEVLATLEAARTAPTASPSGEAPGVIPASAPGRNEGNAPAPTAGANETDLVAPQQLLSATMALTNAIKTIREARTEQDLVHAESELRAAREQMAATCGPSGGGPMCASAHEIEALGF